MFYIILITSSKSSSSHAGLLSFFEAILLFLTFGSFPRGVKEKFTFSHLVICYIDDYLFVIVKNKSKKHSKKQP